jgi:hypothetical protein
VTQPGALNAASSATGLGAFDPYIPFSPPALINARS